MSANAATRLLAGTMLTVSLILATVVDIRWLYLAAFVGANLTQYALSGFCPALSIFKLLGLRAERPMRSITVSRGAAGVSGVAVLMSLGLYVATAPVTTPLILAALVAVNLAQSAFTGACPGIWLMRACGRPQPELTS